ncbi:alpha/beta fold hydrolase [Cellulomonas telluris]|uniref:alpha/beta fold hydrolase n=1 Tax=Cellulomonas telluris TaxID=2306636 RepID=UPI0010A7A15D|nr:alpha/beta hydrolase [Cellulomonas telluris]
MTETAAAPPRRRRRRRLVALGVVAILALVVALLLRQPSPVGHWRSAEGYERYLAAYDEAFRDLPEPAETLDVRTDLGFVRVYRFAGTGGRTTPLVLLPGTASGTPVWADNLPSLLEVADVYTLDLLGEPGRSVQERPIRDHADQAAWLDQTLAALPEGTFHLVGLSIGGWTATNLALHAPERVASLTLIDPVRVLADIPAGTAVRSLPASVPWLPRSWRDSFNSYTAGGAPVEDVPVADMIEAGMQGYAMRLPQPSLVPEEDLGRIDVPVLAIVAEESVMHDASAAVEVAERALQDGTVRLYEGASHAVNGEEPERIAQDVAAFLPADR